MAGVSVTNPRADSVAAKVRAFLFSSNRPVTIDEAFAHVGPPTKRDYIGVVLRELVEMGDAERVTSVPTYRALRW